MKITISALAALCSLISVSFVSAHAVVRPDQVNVGAFQTFTLGVPSEKAAATTVVTLEIPQGLGHVTPNVKPGWRIELTKQGETVTAITWRDGRIPQGQRDDFSFSAQAPAEEAKLIWNVKQTYADGSVVEWHMDPGAEQPHDAMGNADFSEHGPYSVTKVVDDLGGETDLSPWALGISLLALVLAGYAVLRQRA